MSSGIAPSLSHPRRLTLLHLMGVIAAFALAFAFLPMGLNVALAATVISVLVYDGLRWPVVTDGGGVLRWLVWVGWFLALLPCPVAIAVISEVYRHTGPPDFARKLPLPWAYGVTQRLCVAHFWVSVVAWFAVVVLTRGYRRWFAWAVILAIGVLTAIFTIGASMSTTGIYW